MLDYSFRISFSIDFYLPQAGGSSPPIRSPPRLPQFFSPGMLPPPPPPPPNVARPVAILQTSDGHAIQVASSHPGQFNGCVW